MICAFIFCATMFALAFIPACAFRWFAIEDDRKVERALEEMTIGPYRD